MATLAAAGKAWARARQLEGQTVRGFEVMTKLKAAVNDSALIAALTPKTREAALRLLEQPALHLDQLLPSLARTAAARPAGRTLHGAQTV